MAWLIVKKGTTTVLKHEIVTEEIILGREVNCDIVLEDPAVSRKHARITNDGNTIRVTDLQSANGTLVNGERISETIVSHGDIINIHIYSILLEEELVTTTKDMEVDGLLGEKIGTFTELESGEKKGCLDVTENFTIGRDSQNDLSISSQDVSRRHATILLENGQPVIIDHSTANGTLVNEQIVTGKKQLANGDIISVGGRQWVFESELAATQKPQKGEKRASFLSKPMNKVFVGIAAVIALLLLFMPTGEKEENDVTGLINEARNHSRSGQHEAALKVLQKAYEIEPENQTVLSGLEIVTKAVELQKELRRVESTLDTENMSTLLASEKKLLDLKKDDAGNNDIDRLLERVREKLSNQIISERYFSLLEAGKYQDSITFIDSTSHPQKKSYLVDARKGYARQLERRGRLTQAIREWQAVLDIDKQDGEAEQALTQLRSQKTVSTQREAGTPPRNRPPSVGQIQVSKTRFSTDEHVLLSIEAKDADNSVLNYRWQVAKGEIMGGGSSVDYRPNFQLQSKEETIEVTVQVSDRDNAPVQRNCYLTVFSTEIGTDPQPEAKIEEEKPVITEAMKAEAEKFYWEGYRMMTQYKTKKAYGEALLLFMKVTEIVPDENFEYHKKALEKIKQIKKEYPDL